MASAIDPNDIDGSYPVAGQDNNSQGFRDNFTNIKTNFTYAGNEITDLQNKVVLKAALTGTTLDNNMNDALLYAAKIQDFSATKVSVANTSGSISINYAAGHYQAITTSGSISLSFTNFPTTGSYGYLKLQINITNVAHTVALPAAVTLGTVGLQGYSAGTITFGATGTYEFGFGSYDGGSTITIFDLNRALTNFTAADLQIDDLTATGLASVTGNVIGGNLITAGQVVATGNISGGNINTAGLISVTGNVQGGNLRTAGLVSATGNVTGGNIVGFVRPTAGSASQSPVLLASGTNLSVPAAGAFEYDGVVFYGTPTASQRGVLNTQHFIALVNNYTGNDVSTAQKVFDSPANGTMTFAASTTYMLEATYYITRSVGSNSHTLSTLFAIGGGGSLTSIAYTADTTSTASNILGAVSRIYATAATATVVTGASTATNENITVTLRGIIRTNAAGTITPQIQYSADPGGAPTILANSYLRLIPIGTNSVASVGNWS
jgi:hypothetical protein